MILFLVLLLLVGGLVYYWQKDPVVYENFVSSSQSNFSSIAPTVDIYKQTMNGTLYMYYVLTTNYMANASADTDEVPARGGDAGFNFLTNTQLRLATEPEKAYFLRNGGVNRENTWFTFPAEVGAGPAILNKAKLVVSTKPPNVRWDAMGNARVFFTMTPSLFAIETVLQDRWIRGIVRYPFDDSGIFTVFKIDPAEYNQSISDCLFVGKKTVQELAKNGISQIELLPNAPLLKDIAIDDNIIYTDTNIETASASTASASATSISSGSYSGKSGGQTPDSIKTKLEILNGILDKVDGTNFKDAAGAKMSLRKALQQKCGATMFSNKLTFDANVDADACANAMKILLGYNIAFSDYQQLLECTLCPDDNSKCNSKPGGKLPPTTSLAMLSKPNDIKLEPAMPSDSGVTLTIDNIKLGNGFTYELQLVDVSSGADKYIFNPLRFVAGERNRTNTDITKLEIIINEYTNKIQVNSIATNQRTSLGTINTPANFKLYSTIQLQAIIYAYANRSVLSNIEAYSVSYIDQVISDETRYGLYKTDVYSRAASTSKIDFVYNDANSIKATFTYGTTSRIVPGGNYTLNFSNSQIGSFLESTAIGVGQFTHILLNVLTGKLSFMNNSTEVYSTQTKFKESAGDIEFTIALKDPTNKQTYYSGDYTALGNRYDGTVRVKSSDLLSSSPSSNTTGTLAADGREVVYIETPVKDGIDAATATQLAKKLGGELATIDQVVNAMLAGANWCNPGWCIFTNISGKPVIRAAYPITSQILDSKCITQDDSISLYNNGVVVVSTPVSLKAQLMVYRKKENIPSNITQNSLVYKQSYFNAMTGRWKQDTLDISGSEIFAITKQSGTIDNKEIVNIANKLQCTILTLQQIEKQLEYIKGKGIPLPNITVNGWALNNSNFPIKIKLDGKLTTLGNDVAINSLYCYGNKQLANAKLDKPVYNMQPYNAQINMANQNDNAPYKPLNLTTQTLINKASKYNVKAALIIKEARETNGGIIKRFGTRANSTSSPVKEPFTVINDGKYVGCDVNSYACLLDGSGEKQFVPLVSKTNKFKIMDISGSFDKPDTMEQAIQNVFECQRLGGDVAITDDTYPGCPAGYCCEPTEPASNAELNTSMFPETCDDSNSASAIEQCDETEEVLSSNQQSFEPYKLTRIQRTKTPTTAKCNKPKLSKTLKGAITEQFKNTPEYVRDVYEITKNERAFSLRML